MKTGVLCLVGVLALGASRGIYAKNLTTKEPRHEENFATWRALLRQCPNY